MPGLAVLGSRFISTLLKTAALFVAWFTFAGFF